MMKIRILFLFSFLMSAVKGYAIPPFEHDLGFGPELIYNLPLSGIGVGARAHYNLDYHWIVSPQVNFFPGISGVRELNLNLHASYVVNPWDRWGVYLTGGPYINYWMNHESSAKKDAKAFNVFAEVGVGALKNSGCFRPFLEWRYNAKWSESNVRLGFIYYPKICRENRKCTTYQ